MTEYIHNFCIIAHIDHGKSTLADRLLELTGTVPPEEMKKQILDDMDLEQERGITIKAHAIAMNYRARDGKDYVLNLIDTPGHVDFSYEVSRSLAACEGALLVVDAAQGVEAQTISNFYLALESDLKIIPVINKIDLPGAQIEATMAQVTELTGCSQDEVLLVSAKLGTGVEKVLEAVVQKIPTPSGDPRAPLRALIFDSTYDSYRGAVAFIRLFDGELKIGDKICFMSSGKIFEAHEVGILKLKRIKRDRLQVGGVGYLICGAKDVRDMKVGDTITLSRNRAHQPLPGYREVKPMVFSGLYPVNSDDYPELRDSLERLRLNDSSFTFAPETSAALGFGYRCGFLGLLHMEIFQERLEREYGLSIINTVPTVAYRATTTDGKTLSVDSPAAFPNPGHHFRIEEPFIRGQIITPTEYLGGVMKLVQQRRGSFQRSDYLDASRVALWVDFPLSEIIFDFYDRLKSVSRGYASFDYEFQGFKEGDVVKLDILINGEPLDALSAILHRDKASDWGRKLCEKLRQLIPRQLFEVVIQAAVGGRIIARASIRQLRKDVTAKLYGGDVTRKRKLLEKQKEGKKRMKRVGRVEIPQEAFLAVLKVA